jgi:hypothetical protein
MFTNEFEFDSSITTVVDEEAVHEDVQLIMGDGGVFIRQYRPDEHSYDLVTMSAQMFGEMLAALKKPEGLFRVYLEPRDDS